MSRHVIQKGKFLNFVQDGNWEFVERTNDTKAVCGIVWLDGKLVVVEQERIPTGGKVLELPAGLIDAGETGQNAIIREIREETGIVIKPLFHANQSNISTFSSPGLTSESVQILEFNTGDVIGLGKQNLDETEDIKVHLMSIDEIYESDQPIGARLAAFVMGYRSHKLAGLS